MGLIIANTLKLGQCFDQLGQFDSMCTQLSLWLVFVGIKSAKEKYKIKWFQKIIEKSAFKKMKSFIEKNKPFYGETCKKG